MFKHTLKYVIVGISETTIYISGSIILVSVMGKVSDNQCLFTSNAYNAYQHCELCIRVLAHNKYGIGLALMESEQTSYIMQKQEYNLHNEVQHQVF